jgi:hypothetical protein
MCGSRCRRLDGKTVTQALPNAAAVEVIEQICVLRPAEES